jgi:hypothetical protein
MFYINGMPKTKRRVIGMYNVTNGFEIKGQLVKGSKGWSLVKTNGAVWRTFASVWMAQNYLRPMGLMLVEVK